MDELGDQLLPGAAFAGDEHRCVGRGHSTGHFHRAAKGRCRAQHGDALTVAVLPGKLGLDRVRLPRHEHGVRRSPEQDLEVRAGEWLGHIVPRASAQRLETRFHARVAGNHDDNRVGICLETGAQQAHPWDLCHIEIEEHDVELGALEQVAGFVAAPAQRDLVSLVPQHRRAALPERALVVHDQDLDGRPELRGEGRQAHHVPGLGTLIRYGSGHYSTSVPFLSDNRLHLPSWHGSGPWA